MNIFNLFKYILVSLILLFLFHFETFYLGGLKISHLWKGALVLYLLIKIFNHKGKIDYFIYKPFLLLAFLQLINYDFIIDPINAVTNFLIILLIPVIGLYILLLQPRTIKKAIIFFSSFFILSFIPYYFNILISYGTPYDLNRLGLIGTGLVGPYQNAHGAAITLASSLIVIIFFWFEGSFNKMYLLTVFILGITFLIDVYVRTGIAMFLTGGIIILLIYLLRGKRFKHYIKFIPILIITVIILEYLVFPNESFIERVSGQSKYFTENNLESIGSGRGLIYLTSVMIFQNANFIEKIIGMGRIELEDKMNAAIGLKIGSHNAFLQILLVNGIVGLIVFFIYLFNIIKFLKPNIKSNYWILSIALFFSFLVMSFVQGYEWLTANILFMLSISYYYKINNLNNKKETINTDER